MSAQNFYGFPQGITPLNAQINLFKQTNPSISPYVVGSAGNFTTIQSAINAAHTAGGGIIYLQPGTYTENLIFYDKIQIAGTQAYENSYSTIIIGTHTPPLSGAIALYNVEVQSTTDIFYSLAAGNSAISFLNCTFNVFNGYIFHLPNWTGLGFNINNGRDGIYVAHLYK